MTEPPITRLDTLVKSLAQAMHSYLDKPFALLGHSMGALIAFELAREFRRYQSALPACLFISGCRAPQIPDLNPPTYNLPYRRFVEELRRLNGMSEEVLENHELMHFLVPLLRADFEVCQTYVYEPAGLLDCAIRAFGGNDDEETRDGRLEGWRKQTTGSFSMRMFKGDHFYLHAQKHSFLNVLCDELNRIAQALD